MWSFENGRYKYNRIPETRYVARSINQAPINQPEGATDPIFTGDDIPMGAFVQSTGSAAMANGSITTFNHNLDSSHAYPELERATHEGACIGVMRDTDRHLIYSGFALAWLVRPLKTILPITGTYTHTINGVYAGEQVIVRPEGDGSNSFIMFRKADDEIASLRARLDALVGAN